MARKVSPRREYMQGYRQRNLERILQYNREYYWKNREKMLAYQKKYREEHNSEEEKEERRVYHREMYLKYRELKKEQSV
jgi:hypothetical protein